MCITDDEIKSVSRENLTKRQKNLCNEHLAINRDVVCSFLASCLLNSKKPIKCLEGIGVCGINGILWAKYFNEDVDVTINGVFDEDFDLIKKNLSLNQLTVKALKDDPCILLRQNSYDFIYLNCKTNASWYFDSLFSHVKDGSLVVITTSEDPSLYWQTPEIALRKYGGVIGKTSYHKEVSVRLVIAEMARVAARHEKGIKVLCCVCYKPQQSFTIIIKTTRGVTNANNCIQNIKKLAHCNICENRQFVPNSKFLDKVNHKLNCSCSEKSEGKVVIGIGPLWTGPIFDIQFINTVIKSLKGFPWLPKVLPLFDLILQEAECKAESQEEPPEKKIKGNPDESISEPYFYFNTHKHSAKNFRLQKVSKVIKLLHEKGYRASKTHFDSEAVRTNASVLDCIEVLKKSFPL